MCSLPPFFILFVCASSDVSSEVCAAVVEVIKLVLSSAAPTAALAFSCTPLSAAAIKARFFSFVDAPL
jgi:hypothetical protein